MNASTLAATAVGAVFVYAGVAKVLSGSEWPKSAERLGVPKVVALLVMFAEIVIGLGMVLGDSWQRGFLAAEVDPKHQSSVVMAADVCPGECIFIDMQDEDERLTFIGGATVAS
ncbi:MAG: DoxX family membrane protein [Actinobacteria bacterium]|nr:DoxX family membrane protein [Actinomycetota bacterium]